MVRHIRWTHLKERPNQCKTQDKSFINKSYLKIHEQIHLVGNTYVEANKVGDFLCEHCDKSLGTLRSYDRHSLIHTGEKPFQCRVCSKRFRHKRTLQRHELKHTCYDCDKNYITKQDLEKHICMTKILSNIEIEMLPPKGGE